MPSLTTYPASVIIVGGGIAGLTAALKLAPHPVLLLSKTALGSGASSVWAQGGIAAAMGPADSPQQHAHDTIAAAAGTADQDIVRLATGDAPARIAELISLGAQFDRDLKGELALGREAAHAANRILHIDGDGTGAGVMDALIRAVRDCASITVAENFAVEELIMVRGRAAGVVTRRTDAPAASIMLAAKALVLATGGIGGLYAVTTNPPECCGEGLAIAARAGALLADLEFVQFHPTAMDVGISPAPLASEALRGEGALLINETGERFMLRAHPMGELAPRDIVARNIWRQYRDGHKVYLDCRTAIGETFQSRFPTVFALAARAGINPARHPVPVAPAAHYHMGGIATDENGRSSLPGLWACGEVAATGLHGANRLASNSLLEGLVFGARAALDIAGALGSIGAQRVPDVAAQFTAYDAPECAPQIARIQQIMSEYVGVMRDGPGLDTALRELDMLQQAAGQGHARLANMLTAAKLVAHAALLRKESRGGHYRGDFPAANPDMQQRSFFTLADLDTAEARLCVTA